MDLSNPYFYSYYPLSTIQINTTILDLGLEVRVDRRLGRCTWRVGLILVRDAGVMVQCVALQCISPRACYPTEANKGLLFGV
jgi:hypothetical protein